MNKHEWMGVGCKTRVDGRRMQGTVYDREPLAPKAATCVSAVL